MSVILSLLIAAAQTAPATPPVIRPMTERQVEELNIGRTLNGVYAVISGPAGQKRDWAKMRLLFTDDARLYSITSKGLRGGNLDHYIATSGPLIEQRPPGGHDAGEGEQADRIGEQARDRQPGGQIGVDRAHISNRTILLMMPSPRPRLVRPAASSIQPRGSMNSFRM